MRDLPGSRVEPVSPALAGGPLTAGPPEKSIFFFLSLPHWNVDSMGQGPCLSNPNPGTWKSVWHVQMLKMYSLDERPRAHVHTSSGYSCFPTWRAASTTPSRLVSVWD